MAKQSESNDVQEYASYCWPLSTALGTIRGVAKKSKRLSEHEVIKTLVMKDDARQPASKLVDVAAFRNAGEPDVGPPATLQGWCGLSALLLRFRTVPVSRSSI